MDLIKFTDINLKEIKSHELFEIFLKFINQLKTQEKEMKFLWHPSGDSGKQGILIVFKDIFVEF